MGSRIEWLEIRLEWGEGIRDCVLYVAVDRWMKTLLWKIEPFIILTGVIEPAHTVGRVIIFLKYGQNDDRVSQ